MVSRKLNIVILLFAFNSLLLVNGGKKSKDGEKPAWAKKDIRDYSEADLERLLDQWDEDEEPLPNDELPEHLRKPPPIDFSKIDTSDPENLLKVSKKGKTIMTFVQVAGDVTRNEADDMTKLWQSALWNNHIQAERFMVDDNRAIFMFRDGSQAWEAKNFLVDQDRCFSVTIENKIYPGKGNPENVKESSKEKKKTKKTKVKQEL
ncbi:LDLR chaperone boca-like isoform X1 [Daphnia pulex]|uniref:LDLR chaperone boca-like isoform X1 n=1 Tax=Daphnia pulex TaxID=6669 RepID=UPI001EE02CEF|nr:LDLR chaperone boca-like isoform X1 [Daphnia pulex]